MPHRTEVEFIESIDASFPVTDREAAVELIRESKLFSENAPLMVAYELACAEDRPAALRLSLLEELVQTGRAALWVAAPSVRSIIVGEAVPHGEAERLLEHCRQHPGLYNGLNLVELAAPDLVSEVDAVRRSWQQERSVQPKSP